MGNADKGPVGEVLSSFKDKLNGSVTGHYAFAWLLCNWRVPVYLLYGAGDAKARVLAIESVFASDWWFVTHFVVPAIFTALYLFAIPFLRDIAAMWAEPYRIRQAFRQSTFEKELAEISRYSSTQSQMLTFQYKLLSEIASLVNVHLKVIQAQPKDSSDFKHSVTLLNQSASQALTAMVSYSAYFNNEVIPLPGLIKFLERDTKAQRKRLGKTKLIEIVAPR